MEKKEYWRSFFLSEKKKSLLTTHAVPRNIAPPKNSRHCSQTVSPSVKLPPARLPAFSSPSMREKTPTQGNPHTIHHHRNLASFRHPSISVPLHVHTCSAIISFIQSVHHPSSALEHFFRTSRIISTHYRFGDIILIATDYAQAVLLLSLSFSFFFSLFVATTQDLSRCPYQ